MNIAVVGTGYVGLVTGTCFAETGNTVICVDNNAEKVKSLQAGTLPIYEPDIDVLFERNVKHGRLHFTTSLADAVKDAKIIFLALPTPPGEDGSADLRYVLGVAEELGKIITDYKVIVDKSTVPVGTAEKVIAAVKKNAKVNFDVVKLNGAMVVNNAADFKKHFEELHTDKEAYNSSAKTAFNYVRSKAGGTNKILEEVTAHKLL